MNRSGTGVRRQVPTLDARPDGRFAALEGMSIVVMIVPALVAATTIVAVIAWLAGGYRAEMLLAAVGAGGVVVVTATLLLRAQLREQRAAERALQNAATRISRIVESAMDPIITVDEEQRITGFNAAAERVFRWPRNAALGRPLDELLPERFRRGLREEVVRFGRTGIATCRLGGQATFTALRADGEEFPVEGSIARHEDDGRTLFTIILRDVTERVRGEALRARSESRLRGIVDSAMDAIITVDEGQRVVLFNAAAEAMFGCPRREAMGAPLASFIPERFRAAHAGHVERFGRDGTASRRMGGLRVVTGLRRSGEEFPIDAAISQLSEDGGRFHTVILRDVSERVRAEDALRRSQEELRERGSTAQQALEQEKARFARELHDELAQSLAMLQMDIAWCSERGTVDREALAKRLERMRALVDTTIKATRRIAGDLRPLMLDDLGFVPALEWLVENFTRRNDVACDFSVSNPGLDLPDAHATAVFRIVQESLSNVAKHARATRVEVAVDRADSMLAVIVCDDGQGFSQQDSHKSNSYGLLGLRERVSLLGGDLAVSSAPGEGTRIEARLPLASTARPPARAVCDRGSG